MTLFIGCILIYHFHMDWEWYPAAVVVWAAGIAGKAAWEYGFSMG